MGVEFVDRAGIDDDPGRDAVPGGTARRRPAAAVARRAAARLDPRVPAAVLAASALALAFAPFLRAVRVAQTVLIVDFDGSTRRVDAATVDGVGRTTGLPALRAVATALPGVPGPGTAAAQWVGAAVLLALAVPAARRTTSRAVRAAAGTVAVAVAAGLLGALLLDRSVLHAGSGPRAATVTVTATAGPGAVLALVALAVATAAAVTLALGLLSRCCADPPPPR